MPVPLVVLAQSIGIVGMLIIKAVAAALVWIIYFATKPNKNKEE